MAPFRSGGLPLDEEWIGYNSSWNAAAACTDRVTTGGQTITHNNIT